MIVSNHCSPATGVVVKLPAYVIVAIVFHTAFAVPFVVATAAAQVHHEYLANACIPLEKLSVNSASVDTPPAAVEKHLPIFVCVSPAILPCVTRAKLQLLPPAAAYVSPANLSGNVAVVPTHPAASSIPLPALVGADVGAAARGIVVYG